MRLGEKEKIEAGVGVGMTESWDEERPTYGVRQVLVVHGVATFVLSYST